ncbi:MAG: hypothetical protein F4123_05135 [Gemmatimonadetes bacterium]|nr:hypothetical protein [Gemmatimonadota bacterium]MYB97521.1 hypothetical protein [Gemmatimonadota bacterium]MYI45750.1 hypothetical protein [Gemmatimonadota bacterium]
MKRLILTIPLALAGASCDQPGTFLDLPIIPIGPLSLTVLAPAEDPLWEVRDVLAHDGTIWALTASAPYVHGFAPSGELTSRFGDSGEGPGEFRFPSAVWPGEAPGSLTVWDSGSFSALTFSGFGALLSSQHAPALGAIRSDIASVTFGDPFRAVRVPGGLVTVRYDSGVNHGTDLWNGRLVRIPDDGGDPQVLIDFATELPGAPMRPAGSLLAPVPLWDGCPDGRIAVLDPVARTLFMVDPDGDRQEAVALSWHPGPLDADARIAYMTARVRSEVTDGSVSEAEIERYATEAARNAVELFAIDEPLGVDLKCAPHRVWIQEFEGTSHPLGYGPLWRTVNFDDEIATFSRVVFPPDFNPYRIAETHAIGVLLDSAGLQRVATVSLPLFSRQVPSPSPPPPPEYATVAQAQGDH